MTIRMSQVISALFAVGLAGMGAIATRQAWSADETPSDLATELVSVGIDESPAATVNGQAISVGRVRAYQSLGAQNLRLTGQQPRTAREILDGLISDELLYQEAVRRGLEVSAQSALEAIAEARAGTDSKAMEFVLAYASQNSGQKLDADLYWAMPEVLSAFRRSMTVQALLAAISRESSPPSRDGLIAAETLKLRQQAAITISPDFR